MKPSTLVDYPSKDYWEKRLASYSEGEEKMYEEEKRARVIGFSLKDEKYQWVCDVPYYGEARWEDITNRVARYFEEENINLSRFEPELIVIGNSGWFTTLKVTPVTSPRYNVTLRK